MEAFIGFLVCIFIAVWLKRKIFGKSIKVDSFSESKSYKIDPKKITCSCPDFLNRRRGFDKQDPRRLCKHLMSLANISGDEHKVSIMEYFKKHDRGYPVYPEISETFGAGNVSAFLSETPDYVWIDVFFKGKRYGFNIEENRWSYGVKPPATNSIVKWLKKQWHETHG